MPGKLRRLAADERAPRVAAHLRRAFHQFGDGLELDAIRRDVVEEEQRVGARGDDVVDAVRGEVGATSAKSSALAREDELRPDRIGRRREQTFAVQRVQPGERPEPARARRLDCCAEPLDDGVRLRDRDAGGLVRLLPAHGPSVQSATWTTLASGPRSRGKPCFPRVPPSS